MKRLFSVRHLAVVICLLAVFAAWGPVRASAPHQAPTFPTQATANANANLRDGPGTTYAKVGGVKAGDTLLLVACNVDCTWYQLKGGQWIFAELVALKSGGSSAGAAPAAAAKPAAIFGDPPKVCNALKAEGLVPLGNGWSDEALGYFNCFSDDLNVTEGNFSAVGDVPNSLNYGAESDYKDHVETVTLVADIFNTAKEAQAVKSFGAMATTMFQRLGLDMPSGLAAAIAAGKGATYPMSYGDVTLSREKYNLGYGLKLQIKAAAGSAAPAAPAPTPTRAPAPTPTPKPKAIEYRDMLANIWTGVKVYYGNGAEKTYGFEILGGGECSFGKGVFVEYEDGTREWKSRDALLDGPFYVRVDDPATKAWEWYEFDCYQ